MNDTATIKLTDAQRAGLRYFVALADNNLKALRTMRRPDPRVVAALAAKGLIQVVGHNYGAIYHATDAGRTALLQ